MAESKELKKIKKIYGERFMHLCRDLFPTILETEGKLLEILNSTFGNNCSDLYEVIVANGLEDELKNCIYGKIDMESAEKKMVEKKTPYELLNEVGYDLFESTSEEDIQSYKRYYATGEELCTFHGERLDRCVVFWAVRKDVDEIKREDYTQPMREDRYGTSVMGIQFNKKGRCTVSIKNRYNHRVNNPDATYGNDLDRIVPGLTHSFKELLQERGLILNHLTQEKLEIPGYVVANDGKYYKYNIEMHGKYYCPGNIVIDNGAVQRLPNSQMLIDYFVVDMGKKTIETYDKNVYDSFTDNISVCEKIQVVKDNGIRTITLQKAGSVQPISIEINRNNEITGYKNQALKQVESDFLRKNRRLKKIELTQAKTIGDSFLAFNEGLTEIKLPQVKTIGNWFLNHNKALTSIELPQVKTIKNYFLSHNEGLTEVKLPRVKTIGHEFLTDNQELTQLELPRLEVIGKSFLKKNKNIMMFRLPKLKSLEGLNVSVSVAKDIMKIMDRDIKKVTSRDIAFLDKLAELTVSEVSFVRRVFEKGKNIVKNIIRNDRDSR